MRCYNLRDIECILCLQGWKYIRKIIATHRKTDADVMLNENLQCHRSVRKTETQNYKIKGFQNLSARFCGAFFLFFFMRCYNLRDSWHVFAECFSFAFWGRILSRDPNRNRGEGQ